MPDTCKYVIIIGFVALCATFKPSRGFLAAKWARPLLFQLGQLRFCHGNHHRARAMESKGKGKGKKK